MVASETRPDQTRPDQTRPDLTDDQESGLFLLSRGLSFPPFCKVEQMQDICQNAGPRRWLKRASHLNERSINQTDGQRAY